MRSSIDQTIEHIERLYESVTGHEAPHSNGRRYAPIPPEADASAHIEQQLVRLLEAVQNLAASPPSSAWLPQVAIRPEGDAHVIEVDLAGVEREAIKLAVAGNTLLLAGTRDQPRITEGAAAEFYSERPYGKFERRIPLPAPIPAPQLRAELRDGVLRIWVPSPNRVATEPETIAIA
jgi:HSP20 family protein